MHSKSDVTAVRCVYVKSAAALIDARNRDIDRDPALSLCERKILFYSLARDDFISGILIFSLT